MSTYLETLGKLQQQSLDALKQAQAIQVATLTTLGEIVAEAPAFKPATVFENMPTFAELAELNTAFARNVLEQQNAYATEIASILAATQKSVVGAAEQVIKTTAAAVK